MTILIRSPFSEPANTAQAIQWEDSLRLMMPEHGSRNSSIGTILTITIVVSNFLRHTSVTVAKVKRYLRNDISSMRLRKPAIRNAGHVRQGTGPYPMKCGLIQKNHRLRIELNLNPMRHRMFKLTDYSRRRDEVIECQYDNYLDNHRLRER